MTTRTLTALCLAAALLAAGATPAAEVPEGISDGVKVHGHWKIEIYDPDGTLASVTEFENALTTDGNLTATLLLHGEAAHGAWAVYLSPQTGPGPCDDGGTSAACRLGETGVVYLDPLHSTNLQWVGLGSSGGFRLEGSVTADYGSSIGEVETLTKSCSGSISPTACRSLVPSLGNIRGFTFAELPSSVPVLAGQIIQVTVTISFS